MSLKTDKLVQRIAEIQDYVATRLDQDVTYGSVLKELDKISESLKDGKLVLEIASADQVFPTLLQGFLSAQKALPELYTFMTASLPSPNGDETLDSAVALTVLNPLATPSGQTRFALPR